MSILKSKKKTKNMNENGSILLVVLFIIPVILILAIPLLFKFSVQSRTTEKSFKALAAFNLAEAGIDRALWELNQPFFVELNDIMWVDQGGVLFGIIDDLRAADNTVIGDVNITLWPPSGTEAEFRALDSTGKIPFIGDLTVDRTVRVTLKKYFKSIFDFGIMADEGIYSRNNLRIDSYNSTLGDYNQTLPDGSVNRGENGHAGTNNNQDQSIEIDQGTSSEVWGNLVSGVGTDVDDIDNVIDIPSGTEFQGEKNILQEPFEMPPVDLWNLPPAPRDMFNSEIDFKDWFISCPDPTLPLDFSLVNQDYYKNEFLAGKNNSVVLTSDSNGIYSSFVLDRQSTVTVQGNVAIYVTGFGNTEGNFEMKSGSTLIIAENSSLILIMGKTTFSVSNNTIQNTSEVPSNLLILGTSQFTGEMYWRNNLNTYAAIYVPEATFYYDQANIDLYGAIVANRIDLRNNINIHYDEALKDLDVIKGGIAYWRMKSWHEKTSVS